MRKYTLLACLSLACASVLAGERHCLGPGDLSADLVVNSLDISLFVDCLSGPALEPGTKCLAETVMSADSDQDGDLDLLDLSKIVVSFGNSYFDYRPYREDKEAEHLAIELTGELRAPDQEYERIHHDLLLIASKMPELADIKAGRSYSDNRLLVRLADKDDHDEFDMLNSYYGVIFDHQSTNDSGLHLIIFCDTLDAAVLADLYKQCSEVANAEPDFVGCADCCHGEMFVEAASVGLFRYHFSYTYPDHEGILCACWRHRVLETDGEGGIDTVSCTDSCLPSCP